MNYFLYVAEEVGFLYTCKHSMSMEKMVHVSVEYGSSCASLQVRGMLANLGYQKLDDIIGRTDLLRPRNVKLRKTNPLDLSFLLKASYLNPFILGHASRIWSSFWS